MANANSGEVVGTLSMVADSATAGPSTAAQEQVVPLFNNILERNRQNESDVKRLKDLVTRTQGRIYQLELTLKNASRDADAYVDETKALQNALQHFRNLMASVQQITPSNLGNFNFVDLRQNLDEILRQEKLEVDQLETRRAELAKLPKQRAKTDALRRDSAAKSLRQFENLLDQLRRLESTWLKPFASAVSLEKMPVPSLTAFKDGFDHFCTMYDQFVKVCRDLQLGKEKCNKAEANTIEVHSTLKTRLELRRPVEALAPYEAAEMTRLASTRGADAVQVPQVDEELVRSLERLYEWAVHELGRGQRMLQTMAPSSKPSSFNETEAMKKLQAKDNELKNVQKAIAETEQQIQEFQNDIGKKKNETDERRARIRRELEDMRTTDPASSAAMAELLRQLEAEEEQRRRNLDELESLRGQKKRQDTERKDALDALRNKKAALELAVREAAMEAARLEEQLQERLKQKRQRDERVKAAEDRLKRKSLPNSADIPKESDIDRLSAKLKRLEAALDAGCRDLDQLRRINTDAELERRQAANDVTNRSTLCKDLELDLARRKDDLDLRQQALNRERERAEAAEERARVIRSTTFFFGSKTTLAAPNQAAPFADVASKKNGPVDDNKSALLKRQSDKRASGAVKSENSSTSSAASSSGSEETNSKTSSRK